MKTAEPKIIYLQIGEDVEPSEMKESDFQTDGITWCWEKINDNDVPYISTKEIVDMIDEMIENAKKVTEDYLWENDISDGIDEKILRQVTQSRISGLTELKQKIERISK